MHAALKRQSLADRHLRDLKRELSPRDAGQIVCAPVVAVDGKNNVADAASEWGTPQRRLLAENAGEEDPVERSAVARLDGLRKDRNDEAAALSAFVVEGAKLPGHADRFSLAEEGSHRFIDNNDECVALS